MMKLKDLYENYQLKKFDDYRKSSDEDMIETDTYILKKVDTYINLSFNYQQIKKDFNDIYQFVDNINYFISKDFDQNILLLGEKYSKYIKTKIPNKILQTNHYGYTGWKILTLLRYKQLNLNIDRLELINDDSQNYITIDSDEDDIVFNLINPKSMNDYLSDTLDIRYLVYFK